MKLNCLLYGALIAIFLPIFCYAFENDPGSNQHPLSFGSDQTIVDLSKITWEPLNVAGLPSGAEIAVLRGDLVTGGSESILKLPLITGCPVIATPAMNCMSGYKVRSL